MRVKVGWDLLKDIYEGWDFASNEFEVTSEDDGMWSRNAFYAGWLTDKSGQKCHVSFDQEDCKVINWN